jgi:hypothetical protein
MTAVYDSARRVMTPVLMCGSCGQTCYFSMTSGGKRAAFEIAADGSPTRQLHSVRCSNTRKWRNSRIKASA